MVYMVYRALNPDAFLIASFNLNVWLGTINTVVLLTSSMTVAMSITAIQKGNSKLSLILLALTVAAAVIFLVIKYFEWGAKIEHGFWPGMDHFTNLPFGEQLYFYLYFFMTGLHGLHVVVGMVFILIVMKKIKNGSQNKNKNQLLENSGLYWHLVDLIWIYLFPLFYLIH
jgi:cytochrome c oxidase subunit 3